MRIQIVLFLILLHVLPGTSRAQTHRLNVQVLQPPGFGGRVTSIPVGIDAPGVPSASFPRSTTFGGILRGIIRLTAHVPAGGAVAWTGGLATANANERDVFLTSDTLIRATFSGRPPLTVAKLGAGRGTVTTVPAGVLCAPDCPSASASFDVGTAVTLTAVAEPGSLFAGWVGGGCTGMDSCNFTMDGGRNITAQFVPAYELGLSTAGSGSGTVTATPGGLSCPGSCTGIFAAGTHVTLHAEAAPGSVFTGWSGAVCPGTGDCIVVVNENRNVIANFAPETHQLTVSRTGDGAGRVFSVDPAGTVDCGGDCEETLASGSLVTLRAAAEPGSVFAGWSGGGCSGAGDCVTVMSEARAVTAQFDLVSPAELRVSVTGNGVVRSDPGGISVPGAWIARYGLGSSVRLIATPSPGWRLAGWAINGEPEVPVDGLEREVAMSAPTRVVNTLFEPLSGRDRWTLMAVTGDRWPADPDPDDPSLVYFVENPVRFDWLFSPRISDSGQVLFGGAIASPPGSEPTISSPEAAGLWFSLHPVVPNRKNAVLRDGVSLVQNYGYSEEGELFLGVVPVRSLTSANLDLTAAGDLIVQTKTGHFFDWTDIILRFDPLYRPEMRGFGLSPEMVAAGWAPAPFRTIAHFRQRVVTLQEPDATNVWTSFSSIPGAVFLGYERGEDPPPTTGFGVPQVAFIGNYATEDSIFVPPDGPFATALVAERHPLALGKVLADLVGLPDTDRPLSVPPWPFSGERLHLEGLSSLMSNGRDRLMGTGSYRRPDGATVSGLWTDRGTVLVAGRPPPVLPPGVPSTAVVEDFRPVGISPSGRAIFLVRLAGPGLMTDNQTFIFQEPTRGEPTVVIRSGDPVLLEGTPVPAEFTMISGVSVTDTALGTELGFEATVDGQSSLVRWDETNGGRVVVRDGLLRPEFGDGYRLYLDGLGGNYDPAINAQGRIVFQGKVSNSLSPFEPKGIWLAEPDGIIRPLVLTLQHLPRLGQVLGIGDPGSPLRINRHGQVVVRVSSVEDDGVTPKQAVLRINTGHVPPPQFVTGLPSVTSLFCGAGVALEASAYGSLPLNFEWRRSGTVVASGTTSNPVLRYEVPPVTAADEGVEYTLSVSNADGGPAMTTTRLMFHRDFGDSPVRRTLLADEGARHVIKPGFQLGGGVDAESDGQPGSAGGSDGDDSRLGISLGVPSDDEDGVTGLDRLVAGATNGITVAATAAGKLDAWIDFNGNLLWEEGVERVASALDLSAGPNQVFFRVPEGVPADRALATRFRFSSTGVSGPGGDAADGEVEDHAAAVLPTADLVASLHLDAETYRAFGLLHLAVEVTNLGPQPALDIAVRLELPGVVGVSRDSPGGTIAPIGSWSLPSPLLSDGEVNATLLGLTGIAPGNVGRLELFLTPTTIDGLWPWTLSVASASTADPALANNMTTVPFLVGNVPVIDEAPVGLVICEGETATLRVRAHAATPGAILSYAWLRNGLPLPPAPGSPLDEWITSSAGRYEVVVAVTGGGEVIAGPAVVTVNRPPVPAEDTLQALTGAALMVPLAVLLANDRDPDSGTLTVEAVDAIGTTLGTVRREGDSLVYMPPAVAPTSDVFRYLVSDGTCSRTGLVHLRFVTAATPPVSALSIVASPPGADGFLLPFHAPAAGNYALFRAPPGLLRRSDFVELYRVTVTGPGLIAFLDALPPADGASYLVE